MAATDALKTLRGKDYGAKPVDASAAAPAPSMETPRVIRLTDDEQKMFAQAQPGEDVGCEVHGTLDGEGGFRIMSVAPLGDAAEGNDESAMASQVMQRVAPNIAPSPS